MLTHPPGSRTFTFLGTGTSMGVPMLGCDCHVCTSDNPKNHRYRCSALVTTPRGNILIDTAPELRLQLLRESVKQIHAVAYTHYHVDHLFGLDDLRIFPVKLNGPLPMFCTDETEEIIRQAFAYVFAPGSEDFPLGMLPRLDLRRIDERPFEVLGETLTPVPLIHGRFNVFGFRIGNVAYCTDVSHIPDRSWPLLENLDVFIIDALRPGKSHMSHFGLDEALGVIGRVKPKRAYLTHMAHTMEYEELMRTLPPNVEPAYDGLKFTF